MPFLPPNQQRQSTEGNKLTLILGRVEVDVAIMQCKAPEENIIFHQQRCSSSSTERRCLDLMKTVIAPVQNAGCITHNATLGFIWAWFWGNFLPQTSKIITDNFWPGLWWQTYEMLNYSQQSTTEPVPNQRVKWWTQEWKITCMINVAHICIQNIL